MTLLSLGLALLVNTAAAQTKPSASDRKVAIVELAGLGLENKLIRAFESYLERSIGTIDGISTISTIDVDIARQDPRNSKYRDCGGGTRARISCAAGLGKLVGADLAIYGTIGAIGGSYSVNLRAVDVVQVKEVIKYTKTISGSRDRLIPAVRLAAFELVAPEKITGTLKIEIDVAGVVVEIDGKEVGTTPLAESSATLSPGPHVVVLRRPGFKEFQREFEIKPFETAKLKLELELLQRD
ncbi:MAG: PEGA domain-containing protein [Myxococcota bacterium]